MEESYNQSSNDILTKARAMMPSLPKTEKLAAEFLLKKGKELICYNLSEYAQQSNCSEATIIRFCRDLGLSGFAELKKCLANMTISLREDEAYRITSKDDMNQIFKKVIWYYNATLQDTYALFDENYGMALEALKKAKRVKFFGVGDAWVVCVAAQMKFARIGIQCTAPNDLTQMLAEAVHCQEGDVAVAVSFSGDTKLVVNSVEIAKEHGATTICITNTQRSRLTKCSDIKLFTATTDVTLGDLEVARRVAENAILDSLYMGLLTEEGKKYEELSRKVIETIHIYK